MTQLMTFQVVPPLTYAYLHMQSIVDVFTYESLGRNDCKFRKRTEATPTLPPRQRTAHVAHTILCRLKNSNYKCTQKYIHTCHSVPQQLIGKSDGGATSID